MLSIVAVPKLPSAGNFFSALFSSPEKAAWLVLGSMFGVTVVLVLRGVTGWVKKWRERRAARGISGPVALGLSTLAELWERFLKNLPRGLRQMVARYPAVIVFGPVGSGKSAVIRSFVDWQGQKSQFLPSLTDSPLLQVYLGGKLLVEELSAQILANTSAVAGQALRRLWAPVCREQAPMGLVVLKLATLEASSPEQREELAHQVRGKLALLGKLVGAPIEARLCLTHLDQVRGFVQTARFCAAHRIPMTLSLQDPTAGGDDAKVPELSRYLPLALTKLAAAEFREVVLFLKEIPRLHAALDGFLKPLREWNIASPPPIVERLYLYSNQEGASGSNPFAGRRVQPVRSLAGRFKSLIPPSLRGAQWHLISSASIVLLAAVVCLGSALRQRRAIQNADEAIDDFAQAVHRAQATLGDVRDSPAVRTASHAAREAIEEANVTQEAWFLQRIVYRGTKTLLTRRLLETVRQAYFLPLLPRYGAQRDIERTLYALAVIYSARNSALGSLVASELQDMAKALGISDAIITDYVQLSASPWSGAAAVPWTRLVSGEPPPAAQAETWLRYFLELQQVYRAQAVSGDQLRKLQQQALPLMRVADAVRTKRKLAQILNAIAEESPLVEIEERIGSRHLELAPPQWLRDQQVAISGALHMVHDTDQQAVRAGQMSLVQVLRLLTDLDERKRGEDQVFAFEIDERAFSYSARGWSDMLLRGRHQLVLGALYKAGDLGAETTAAAKGGNQHLSSRGEATVETTASVGHHRRRRHHKGRTKDQESADGKRKRHHRDHGKDLPEPAAAKNSREDEPISPAEARQYSRISYEQDMKSLLAKLDKALGDDSGLPAQQKQYLTSYVQAEARRYAARYCAALNQQYASYLFPGGPLSSTRSALLDLLTPSGSLLTHLKAVADNASLSGLDGRFAQPLASCLIQLKPLVTLAASNKDGAVPGLKPYGEIIAGVVKELDSGKPAELKEDGKPLGLNELLSPLGRIGLSALMELETSPERKVGQFVETVGLGGPLAGPLLAPVKHLSKLGLSELEQTLAQQWDTTLLPMVRPVLARYPFDRRAERELQPTELDVLKPMVGPFWQTFRQIFGPVCAEQGGTFSARKWARGSVTLPKDMLPLVNQLAVLSNTLFAKDGARRAFEIAVKALPVSVCDPQRPAAVSFLAVGKAQVFGTNTRPALTTLSVPWWQQDIASVGLEFSASGQPRSAQSIEVADSMWNLFRLLERASAARSVMTWTLPAVNGGATCEVRFEIEPNPMNLFRLR